MLRFESNLRRGRRHAINSKKSNDHGAGFTPLLPFGDSTNFCWPSAGGCADHREILTSVEAWNPRMHQEKKQRKCHFYPVGLSLTGSGTLSLRHVWLFAGCLRVCGEESREDFEAAKVKILRLMQSA